MDMVQDAKAVTELVDLVGLWTEGDGQAVLSRSGRMAMGLNQLLGEIELEMVQLSDSTRTRNGIGLQLTLQRRSTGAVALRWKVGQRVASAEALDGLVGRLPTEVGHWYRDVDAKARWLNARERLVRHARQVLRDLYAVRN